MQSADLSHLRYRLQSKHLRNLQHSMRATWVSDRPHLRYLHPTLWHLRKNLRLMATVAESWTMILPESTATTAISVALEVASRLRVPEKIQQCADIAPSQSQFPEY